jgi:hypothetical protein
MAMANVTQRIKDFLRSPAGQRLIAEGKRQLAKPENRQKLKALAEKVTKRR